MRREHFQWLSPVCPVCRPADGSPAAPLEWGQELAGDPQQVLEGTLLCTRPTCRREFPIIDGVPLLVVGLRELVQNQWPALTARRDLHHDTTTLLGDCLGPDSTWEYDRQQQSSYVWSHYGALDSQEPGGSSEPPMLDRFLERAIALAGPLPNGAALEVGCAVGGGVRSLAAATGQPVLGVDYNLSFLRTAAEIARTGRVRYARRRVGLVYDLREFPIPWPTGAAVDFWAADALALPLEGPKFTTAVAWNVLDSTGDPAGLLAALARAVQPGGRLLATCPYDWSTRAAPPTAWLGGHSQRGPGHGASEPVLRQLLNQTGGPWQLLAEDPDVPWPVRLHERSTMLYRTHLVVAERTDRPVAS